MKNSVRSGERRRRVLGSLTAGALIAGTLSAFGFAAAAPASAATQLEKSYNYKCDVDAAGLPLGIKDVGVRAAVEVPDSVAPGETIPARKTQIVLTMPEDLRSATTGLLGAKTAGGSSSDAAITITAPGVATPMVVPIANLSAPQTNVPTTPNASWTIPTEGDVPAITVPSEATDAATLRMPSRFTVDATLIKPDGSVIGSEGAVKMDCNLDAAGPNGDGVFGAIPIALPANLPPVAQDLSLTTDAGQGVAVSLAATDPEGEPLTFTTTAPPNGTLTGTPPALTYTPDDGFLGVDTFTYTVSDGVNEVTKAVTINVKDPSLPLVTEDIALADPVHRGMYAAPTVVALQGSGGSGTLSYEVGPLNGPDGVALGSVTVAGDEATVVLPEQEKVGAYSFTYTAKDAGGQESTSTVTFTVENVLASVRDLRFTTTKDKPLDTWPYARDPESGGPFPWIWDTNRFTYGDPEHGTVVPFFTETDPTAPGAGFTTIQHKATYVPDPGFVGTDSFTYTMTDTDGDASTGTITVDVVEPAPAARGVLNDVRYRCAFAITVDPETGLPGDADDPVDPGTSNLVSTVMGGDVTFRVDVRAHMPTKLAPGQKFTVPDTEIDLKMAQPMAELLAGKDIAVEPGEPAPPLDEAGFGQTAVEGKAKATAVFTESATGDSYEVPMTGLASAKVPMTQPVPSDGITIPVTGGLPQLTAPQSGELSVSMPESFFINSILTPGVLGGVIQQVGLDCTAMEGEDLVIGSAPVVDVPVAPKPVVSSVKASVKGAPYGVSPRVAVTVAPAKAGGRVEVRKGSKVLARTTVAKGRATVVLPRTALRPGKHTLAVRYLGDKATKASSTKVTVKITKAKTKVSAKVTTKKVVAKKTRAKVRVKVKATGMRPAGRVAVFSRGKRIGVAKVRANGTAVVKLRKLPKVGKATLKVKYLGNAKAKASTKKIKIKVKRR